MADQKLRDVEQQLEDLARFRDALDRMLREWDARLAKMDGRAPAKLLESLASKPQIHESPLRGLAFDRRRKGKERK
jgi:hypothetical protein